MMFTPKLIAPHGGYNNLKSYQNAEIIYDLTVEFCRRCANGTYGSYRSYQSYMTYRLTDQMVQAGRSGTRNIAEASQTSGTSKQSELRLLDVARASFAELLGDYVAFLRQNNLKQWRKDDEQSLAVRRLAYKSYKSHLTYMSYFNDTESAANCTICLINQTTYLLDQQIKSSGNSLISRGDLKERIRTAAKHRFFFDPIDTNYDEILRKNNMRRLTNGRVVALDDPAVE